MFVPCSLQNIFYNGKRLGNFENEIGIRSLGHNFHHPLILRGYNKVETIKELWNISDLCINEDPKQRPSFMDLQEKLIEISSLSQDHSFTNTFTQ